MDTNEKINGTEQVVEENLNDTKEAAEDFSGISVEQAEAILNEDTSAEDKGLNKFMAILGIIILILAIPASYYTAHVGPSKDFFEVAPQEFHETYAGSVPKGFLLSEQLENNPLINNYLQLNITYDKGKDHDYSTGDANTGCAVMFATLDASQPCINMALVTGNDLTKEEFQSLAEWYLSIAAPKADKGFAAKCADVYDSKSMGYDGITLEDREISFIYQPDAIMNNGIIAVAKIENSQDVEEGAKEGKAA